MGRAAQDRPRHFPGGRRGVHRAIEPLILLNLSKTEAGGHREKESTPVGSASLPQEGNERPQREAGPFQAAGSSGSDCFLIVKPTLWEQKSDGLRCRQQSRTVLDVPGVSSLAPETGDRAADGE